MLPTSPIKTFAGLQFQIKKASREPLKAQKGGDKSRIYIEEVITTDIQPATRPSRPSKKFTKFTTATKRTRAKQKRRTENGEKIRSGLVKTTTREVKL